MVVLPWWVVIALCSDSKVQSLHCAVTVAGAAGGFGGGVFVLVGDVSPYDPPCFHTCMKTWRDLVFAQVYAENAADGHDAVEEGSVVGCGGGNGDTASLSRGS